METTILEQDIVVFYIQATSFPDGVLAAHQELHKLVPLSAERNYYGLSRPEGSTIQYKSAAAEMYPGEGADLGCKTLVLKKGKYVSRKLTNFMEDIPAIGQTFQEMLQEHEQLDPEGYCVEWYVTQNDVICMIRVDQ